MTLPQALAIAVTGVTVNYTYTVVIEDQDDDNVTCDIRDVQPAVPFFSMKGKCERNNELLSGYVECTTFWSLLTISVVET